MPFFKPMTCLVCGCGKAKWCNDGCGWADNHENLCLACSRTAGALRMWAAGTVNPDIKALIVEAFGLQAARDAGVV